MCSAFFLFFLAAFATAKPYAAQCKEASLNDRPPLTLQFTPAYPIQTAPTSTVYGAIVTSYMNAVDCNYVSVENIDNNPPQTGEFTARMTIPTLTLYRVGCMPFTTVVSRRDHQASNTVEPLSTSSLVLAAVNEPPHINVRRTASETSTLKTLLGIAEHLSSGIDPTNENMTVGEFEFLQEINTALFALNIVNAGLPLNEMCQYLHDPDVGNHLEDNLINQDQAANIVCFASVYGLYLQKSNQELLADLATLEYAIQMRTYKSETLQDVCESLDYQAAGLLGIDIQGIRNNVCNGTAGVSHSTDSSAISIMPTGTQYSVASTIAISPFPTTPAYPGTGLGTGYHGTSSVQGTGLLTSPTAFGTGVSNSAPVLGTGSVITNTIANVSPSIIFGTNGPVFSSAISAAGTVAPWLNTTITTTAAVTTTTASAEGPFAKTSSVGFSFYNPPQAFRNVFH